MGLLDNIGNKLSSMSDDDKRGMALGLASGFAGMSGNPNTGNIMQGISRQQDALAARREKTTASNKQAAQAGMAIKMLGDKFPMLTQAVQAGIISPNEAIVAARKGADVKVVGKSLVDSLGNVLFTSEDAGSGSTTAFDTLKLRAKDAGLEEGTPAYQQFMIEGGAKKGMAFTSDGKGGFTLTQGGAAFPKLTETQGKAVGFYDRANKANALLNGLEQQGTEVGARLIGNIPFGAGNFAQSSEYQQFEQAQRDFINAILRQESGAAIGKDEFVNAERQYFPQVGDKPEVIEQKRRNRETSANALRVQAGVGAAALNQSGQNTTLTYDPVTGELK
mgnify:FL=1|tara:strand:- start:455 stop:1456 length:1002 start_codon:yes stop_codon:yes gene_type:complete